MSVELIKKPITLDEMTKKETMQVIKERDLIVPDGKPDMEAVISLDGEVNIDQVDVSSDRIMYRGNINVCILYTTASKPKCVFMMKGNIPIEDFVILDGVNKDQKVDFDYEIEHMSYNILNERKINVKAIMQVEVKATGCKDTTIITGIETEDPVQTKEDEVEIVSLGDDKEEKVIVKEDLNIASTKPCVGEILKTKAQIKEEQIKHVGAEIKFNGIIEVVIMYKVSGDEDDIQIVSHRVPFEGAIENVDDDEKGYWNCTLDVTPSYMQVTPDYDGEDRIIESEFIVTARYNTFNKEQYQTISDIYCPGKKVNTKEKQLEYMNLVDKVEVSMPKKEAVAIEENNADSTEVFCVEVKPTVDDKTIEGNKVNIQGTLEIKVTSLCKSEDRNDINTSVSVVPFSQDMDIQQAPERAYIMPYVKAKDVNIYAQTKKELVVEYLLDCRAEVYAQDLLNVLEEIDIEDMSKEEMDAFPSMTVYQIKKGDSLWNLAKRFNTTIKDISEINDIDFTDNLKEGQKIIILKKVKF